MAIQRLNDYPDPDHTDPFGTPACTMVGMPAPMHLPARRRTYADKYPPQIDEPVEILIVPDDDTVIASICDLSSMFFDGELSKHDADLYRLHLATCSECAGRLHLAVQLEASRG